MLAIERGHLLTMASEGFDRVEASFARVEALGRVRVRTNASPAARHDRRGGTVTRLLTCPETGREAAE